MDGKIPAVTAIPALLSTQLMAAEVYSTFLHLSSDSETHLWEKLLMDELEHVKHLKTLLFCTVPPDLLFQSVNLEKMRESCNRILLDGNQLFLLRLEGALRLECAELDYGLEGMVARKMEQTEVLPGYPGNIAEHIAYLLSEANRYSESPNIRQQMLRLTELFETTLKAIPIIPSIGAAKGSR